jgi:membrane protease YdiL (CAAX protease family)
MNSIFGIEAPSSKIEILVANRSISSNILLVVVAVVAPFSEEIFFRGFLYSAFKKSWGVNAALFLSSILFAVVHLELYSFIPLVIIGWILAYLFEKTKSLMPAIFLHGVYNLILILILLGQLEIIRLY